jgi:hypothetical protein
VVEEERVTKLEENNTSPGELTCKTRRKRKRKRETRRLNIRSILFSAPLAQSLHILV